MLLSEHLFIDSLKRIVTLLRRKMYKIVYLKALTHLKPLEETGRGDGGNPLGRYLSRQTRNSRNAFSSGACSPSSSFLFRLPGSERSRMTASCHLIRILSPLVSSFLSTPSHFLLGAYIRGRCFLFVKRILEKYEYK